MSAEMDTEAGNVANTSGITPATIETALKAKLAAQYVKIDDISGGCGQAYEATIVSPLFVKKTTLARHRLVNSALKAEIAAIHAWTPKCHTPEEWERKQAQEGVGLPQGV
ncbi:hypothetical protein MMC24_006595 [Lignoscripta atroalba]|nr:hypothetical protein [Lignoscripta atroalba]